MFTTKTPVLLCLILCLSITQITLSQINSAAFTFKLTSNAHTSAGVYTTDSTLVRTLWADSTFGPGTYTRYWDGKDDYGNTIISPDATYNIKVLTNNVNYTWDGVVGNTSTNKTGTGVHRGYYTSMTGMAITGTTAYFCQGYSEAYSSEAKFSTTAPNVRLDLSGFGGRQSTIQADFVATDGTNVYWAGWNPNNAASCRSLVHATAVSNDAQVSFGVNGQSYIVSGIGAGKTYASVIDFSTATNSTPTGLAVSSYLFVAHGGLNQLKVFNKTTGALAQTLTYTNPRGLAIEGTSLWMVSGTNTVAKYTVNANGTLTAATLTLSGISTPGAIAVNGGNIAVVDAGTNQILRFYNTSTGTQGTQLGTTGGYATSPNITNTKYMFNDYRGRTDSYISFASDGSFWFGDAGNARSLHFNSSKTYVEYIMSLPTTYSTCVDPNDISRVFANYLEFDVDYAQSLTGSTGWTLTKNWSYGINMNWSVLQKLLNVVTLSNGRTYGSCYEGGLGYVELTSTGLRATGVPVSGTVNKDGSQMKVSGSNALGSTITFTSYPLTGFTGAGNPTWSASGTLLATTPTNTLAHPNTNPGSVNPPTYNYLSSTNKVIFYTDHVFYNGDVTKPYTGYHLGAIKKGDNKWLWETQKVDHAGYQGAFPGAEYFEIGNGVNQLAGSNVNVIDNNIVTGYHGEFWKGGQTNRYNHYLDDGLAVGQFGTDFWEITHDVNTYPLASAGFAGNALTPLMVKDGNGNLYLYHGDESFHAGIHRWTISNLASISEQIINIPFPSAYTPPVLDYVDLHAGLPSGTILPNNAGWSKTGVLNSVTGSKKCVTDGSPDVFTTFVQGAGTASVNRDLGTNDVTNSWEITGQLSFEGSDVTAGSQITSYVDVLDASDKILARFNYTSVYATGVTTIYGNSVNITSAGGLAATLLQFQPFDVKCVNGTITFTYADYSPVSTPISDGTGNWRKPKTFRQYFTGANPAYGKNIGFMDMKFYKDYSTSKNIAPTANAGSNQTITLPANSVTLSGSGTDSDGTIASYSWKRVSGPASGSITNSNSATTSITALAQGVYAFELKVTDNSGASDVDTVQITVDAAVNIAPSANAGSNQTITLPANSVTLSGSGTDPDGTITGYSWKKIAGPTPGSITNSNNATTTVTALTQGVFKFELKVTDNSGASDVDTVQITVDAAVNIAPTANAGSNQTITLPANSVTLSGSGTDPDGTITSYSWKKVSGPASGSITNSNSATTSITALTQGVYAFELNVIDNSGATGVDTVLVTVNVAANIPPVASAGTDSIITLPANNITLTGNGTDADGSITNYAWTKISGPSSGTITNPNNPTTPVPNLSQGTYKFELKITDNLGASDLDTVQIIVNPPANLPPVANAGPDQKITLPVNIVSLAGSGGDADGTIAGYLWTRISGPSSYNIVNASSPVTDISGLVNGVYTFQLEVTDNSGATARDTIQITVNAAANVAPLVDAGQDIALIAPANTASLKGTGTDSDGSVVGYLWTKISGPSSYNIVSNTSPATNVTGLVLGIYMFELRVTDNNGAMARDTIQVTVIIPANIPPIANAGTDQVISLPKNTLQLNGSGTDPDGSVSKYLWRKIAGPSSGVITNANIPATSVSTLIQGFYSFEIMVTDNKGAVGKDTVEVAVMASSLPLKLLSFAGKLRNDQVDLNWETTNEKNVLGFDIERMTGNTWAKIGFVASSSTNVLSNHYACNDNFPMKGINYYRLKIVDIDGKFVYSDIINIDLKPSKNLIYQNFPNPFSNFTDIKFEIAEKTPVKIIVYNAIGIQIAILLNEIKEPGLYQVRWNAENVATGNYYYKVIIGENIVTKKILKMH